VTTHDAFTRLLHERHSVRAYLATPVAQALLEDVMSLARLAPSGANLQPGSFIAVQGEVRRALSAELVHAWRHQQQEAEDYSYFPEPMPMSLKRRQMASARALYDAIGVAREDRAGRDAQFERNFHFFDAPVALVVTIAHDLGSGCYMDLGMALYGLMLAAQSKGLSTCAIGAMASYPHLIRRHLGLNTQSKIVCGVALGYADPDASVNQTRTARVALSDYFNTLG
jgi:nitroreductase